MTSPETIIRHEARRLGFTLAGISRVAPLERGTFFRRWLAEGRSGEMAYLARKTAERIDPGRHVPWARSVVSLAHPYPPPPPPPADWRETLRGRIAAYALGTDYHDRVSAALRALVSRLGALLPGTRFLPSIDTGPVLEREWALRAGLGWIGRNTLVLDRQAGSYFFLAELFTDAHLDPATPGRDHCGTCTRCVSACPTGALDGAYAMDPRRCLAYLTIEHRSAIPLALRPALGNWIFGCDLCQEACPWNGDIRGPEADALAPHLPTLLALDGGAFRARFRKTAVARTKRRGLLRNVAVALGNSGNPDAVGPLTVALASDPEPLVRAHAAWALGRLGGRVARAALERAGGDEDRSVAAEAAAARA